VNRNRIKIIAVCVVAALLIVGTCATMVNGVTGFPQPAVTQQDDEVEDCDAEDWINREDDCGFTKPKATPRKTTGAPRVTAKPKPAVTRR
jgi:hypothetical protein